MVWHFLQSIAPLVALDPAGRRRAELLIQERAEKGAAVGVALLPFTRSGKAFEDAVQLAEQ